MDARDYSTQSPSELAQGYIVLAVLAAITAFCLLPTIQLFAGGVRHPNYRTRLVKAWVGLAVLPLILCVPLGIQPIDMIAVLSILVLGWPVYRDLGAVGWLARLTVAGGVAGLLTLGLLGGRAWWSREFEMPPGNCNFLEHLRPAQAKADADAALVRNDQHLLGIYGYTLSVPGVFTPLDQRLHPVQPIECTSDYVISRKHARLMDSAVLYARAYNRRVLGLTAPETQADADRDYGGARSYK